MINKQKSIPAALLILLLGLFISQIAFCADRYKCPVCGEIFDSSVKICPNDGTDLSILGKPVEKGDNKEKKTQSSLKDDKNTTKKNDNKIKEPKTEIKKYRRQDRGGKRKREAETATNDEEKRTERMRRIGDKRAGVEEPAPRKKHVFNNELNQKIRSDFLNNLNEKRRKDAEERLALHLKELKLKRALKFGNGAPVASLGTRLTFMPEGKSPGRVAGAEVDVNFLRTNIRMGISSFVGNRKVNSRRDFIFMESLTLGFQFTGKSAPFLIGRFGLGALLEERFGEMIGTLLRNVGLEAGVDYRLSNGVVLTPSFGFSRFSAKQTSWNNAALKFSVGF